MDYGFIEKGKYRNWVGIIADKKTKKNTIDNKILGYRMTKLVQGNNILNKKIW